MDILESLSERQDNLQDAIVQLSKAFTSLSQNQVDLASKIDKFLDSGSPEMPKDVRYYN